MLAQHVVTCISQSLSIKKYYSSSFMVTGGNNVTSRVNIDSSTLQWNNGGKVLRKKEWQPSQLFIGVVQYLCRKKLHLNMLSKKETFPIVMRYISSGLKHLIHRISIYRQMNTVLNLIPYYIVSWTIEDCKTCSIKNIKFLVFEINIDPNWSIRSKLSVTLEKYKYRCKLKS